MATDVIIPARNEAGTVGAVVRACLAAPSTGRVFVVDDGSTDDTATEARAAGAEVVRGPGSGPRREFGSGKGEAVTAGLRAVTTERVLFCDADYTGLTGAHVEAVAGQRWPGIVAGVLWRDFPCPPDAVIAPPPVRITNRRANNMTSGGLLRGALSLAGHASYLAQMQSIVTGLRTVPVWLVRDIGLAGYVMENQIEHVAALAGVNVRDIPLVNYVSPLRRQADIRIYDAEWSRWLGRLGRDIPIPVPPQREEAQ